MAKKTSPNWVERLMDFLTALGQDVEITVRPTGKEHGAVSVVLA